MSKRFTLSNDRLDIRLRIRNLIIDGMKYSRDKRPKSATRPSCNNPWAVPDKSDSHVLTSVDNPVNFQELLWPADLGHSV